MGSEIRLAGGGLGSLGFGGGGASAAVSDARVGFPLVYTKNTRGVSA